MRIAIIGAGMGGLAAACLLSDQGHEVTIFDQFDTPRPVGSGLVIQPVGQAVLATVGALDHAQTLGNPVRRMLGVEAVTGRKVLDVSYDLIDPAAHGLAIHRASLFEALWHAMRARPGITLCPSTPVTRVQQDVDSIEINSENETHGPFEMAIDASGAGSPLSPLKAQTLGYGAVWGTVDWPGTDIPQDYLSQRYQAASHMIGALPIGRLPGDDRQKAAIFWSLPTGSYDDWKAQGLDAWKAQATSLWPAFAPFIEHITDPAQMTMARYSHGTLKRPYNNRLVHIGDAAHRASPQLGQGANMALLDAYALARALETRPISRALPAFARARRLHTNIYQAMSWAFTPMYQSDSRLLPLIRDRLLFPASTLWPAPRILTKLVCGTLVPPHRGL